jgi:hypothetical protein
MKEKFLKTFLWVAVALALLPAAASADLQFGDSVPGYAIAKSTSPNTTITLLDVTNHDLLGGPGSLRGIACLFVGPPDTANPPGSLVNIYATVDGGARQTITLNAANFAQDHSSGKQEFTDWLPFHIIFGSLKLELNRNNNASGTYNSIVCQATYTLFVFGE